MKQGKWIKFKDGQYPRTNEIIVVKSHAGLYPYLIKVIQGPLTFCRYNDESTRLSFHGITHWQLIEMGELPDEINDLQPIR